MYLPTKLVKRIRFCIYCGKRYETFGKFSRVCDECIEERRNKRWKKYHETNI